ncbi:MAG: glycoside hydrolase [[Candidatus Thermochlorobacteriaceae] bacterium GBChlB]|nr:MAG: glycoside hydrolase [[Candidatus Thermochlorobacteriaceae] bacterium GBChlB]
MRYWFVFLLSLFLFSCNSSTQSVESAATTFDKPGWTFVWGDEFDTGNTPDREKWQYDLGGNGWGNQELQRYTNRPENARIENGRLLIEARREALQGNAYTSARLKTVPSFTFGRFEISAKLPTGVGTWPAIWMLYAPPGAYGGWPASGEMDIMEHVGFDQDMIHATIHTQDFNHLRGTQVGEKIRWRGVSTSFNVYALEWANDSLHFFINDTKYFSFYREGRRASAYPFDKPFQLILNIAVGGTWGGLRGVDTTVFPQRMEIDYVRIYRRKE